MIAAAFIGFLLLLCIGAPVAFAIGAAAVVALQQASMPLSIVPQRLFGSMDSFTLLAIPLFILAGELMNSAGISRRLVHLASTLVGHLRGGIGIVAVVSEYLVSGVSGSAVADTAAIGSTMIPAMQDRGYTRQKAVGVVCGACAMGILVPPSISMVLYGGIANVSIGALFIAGFLPAMVTALAMMVLIYIESAHLNLRVQARATLRELGHAALDATWALLMPVIIFAGILGGIFTPTEAAVVAVVYSLLIDRLIYREIDLRKLHQIMVDTVLMTGVAVFLIAASAIFAWYLTIEQVPQRLAGSLLSLQLGPVAVMLGIFCVFLVLGMFMDGIAAMIMVVPLLLPVVPALGLDPLHLGVVIVAAIGIGLFTPPVGAGLFVACSIGKVSIEDASRAFLPYLLVIMASCVLIIAMPSIVTLLPRSFGL